MVIGLSKDCSLSSEVCGRYLDNNTLTGTLDIVKMYDDGLLQNSSFEMAALEIMSLSNNSIEHVITTPNIIANTTTLFK